MASDVLKALRLAQKAATKRLPVKRDKVLNEDLQFACGSLADAYCIGAEEAQCEILSRILLLISRQQRAEDQAKQPQPGKGGQ